jgi:hypothetical protein
LKESGVAGVAGVQEFRSSGVQEFRRIFAARTIDSLVKLSSWNFGANGIPRIL